MRLYWRGKQAETEHMRFPAKVEVKDPLLLRKYWALVAMGLLPTFYQEEGRKMDV